MPVGVGRSSSRLSRASRRSVEPSQAMCTFVRRLKPTRAACLSNSAVYGLCLSCSANGATACAWARSFSRVRWARSASSLPCSLDSRVFRLFSRLSRKLISFHDTIADLGLRLGAFVLARAVGALRIFFALLARFQGLQTIFEVVEKTHLLSRYDSRVSDFRTRLKTMRDGMLRLHKSLLELERAAYTRDVAPITSTGQYLNLVMDDPAFQWLRELSAFIVMVDEALAQKAPP